MTLPENHYFLDCQTVLSIVYMGDKDLLLVLPGAVSMQEPCEVLELLTRSSQFNTE